MTANVMAVASAAMPLWLGVDGNCSSGGCCGKSIDITSGSTVHREDVHNHEDVVKHVVQVRRWLVDNG